MVIEADEALSSSSSDEAPRDCDLDMSRWR